MTQRTRSKVTFAVVIFVTIGLVGWCAYLTWRVHQLSEGRDAPRLRDRFAH